MEWAKARRCRLFDPGAIALIHDRGTTSRGVDTVAPQALIKDHGKTPTGPVGRPGLEPGTLGLKVPCSTR